GNSGRKFRYLTGADRFAIYLTAAGTGLRTSELASLAPASFDLAATPAVVRVQSAYTKNRKQAELPLPVELSNALRGYLAGKPADAPAWPGTWSNAASAKMIRLDLAESRKAWLKSLQDARQRAEAEQSGFLAYRNAAGLVADFHSLRHLFISRVVRSGATPKVAQELARHCDVRLTQGRYAHAALHDLTAAVSMLRSLLRPETERAVVAATGTKGGEPAAETVPSSLGPNLGPRGAVSGDSVIQSETERRVSSERENTQEPGVFSIFHGDSEGEAPPGFEPGMAD